MSLSPDRDLYFNASDAPAMLGISPHEKREALLERIKYGISKPITPAVQAIFDAGHRIEALARPIAEALVGHPFPPRRFTRGKLGATLDGYYIDDSLDSVNWECKTLNKAIEAAFDAAFYTWSAGYIADDGVELPEYLCAQIEQQLICSEADKCLFTAFDGDIKEAHCWYYPDSIMRQRIIDGWAQFEKDLAAMPDVMPAKAIEGQLMPVVRSFPQLPALQFGLVTGKTEVLKQFEQDSRQFVSTINQNLQTDQDFADGESDKKELIQCVERLDSLINAPQDLATLKRIRDLFNNARLNLEKQLTGRKEARKVEVVYATRQAYEKHVLALELPQYIRADSVDFKPVIKQLSSIASMQNALSAALLKAQSEATAQAVKIRANLNMIALAGNDLLFTDKPTLVHRLPEDVQNAIKVRLAEHAAKVVADAEKARLAAAEKSAIELAVEHRNEQVATLKANAVTALSAGDDVTHVWRDNYDSPRNANERVLIGHVSIPNPSNRMLNVGQINERLKVVTVTTAQLVALGFPGVEGPRKGLSAWPESDYPRITAAIKARI